MRGEPTINYTSATGTDGNIVIPGESQLPSRAKRQNDEEGIVITPDPTGIVIKTRLLKEKQQFSFDKDNTDASYFPQSLSSIYAGSLHDTKDSDATENSQTKVFLNVVTHPLIQVPCQRKGIDDETGKEIDGWRLPMSMGDLRPCYDKQGQSAIVADCILNPRVVREMNTDSNHFQFVCDLVVQCASRKFGKTWFGGLELDRKIRFPKMNYAGYIDESTGLPIISDLNSNGVVDAQKAVVAKQRVKGNGGKSIIQEVESTPSDDPIDVAISDTKGNMTSNKALTQVQPSIALDSVRTESKEKANGAMYRIELFVSSCNDNVERIPLFDFLTLVADQDGIVAKEQPSRSLRELIKAPVLKQFDNNVDCHESQLLNAPTPIDTAMLMQSSALPWSSELDHNEQNSLELIAKCSITTTTPPGVNMTTPKVELSAFLLKLSSNSTKTECILPFPVDIHDTTTAYNRDTGVLEVRMPLLQAIVDDNPDPGTRPWELQNALGGKSSSVSKDESALNQENALCNEPTKYSPINTFFDSYFVDSVSDDDGEGKENEGESNPLPEDEFHSNDILSRHYLYQQEEEKKQRMKNHGQSRDGVDAEYININDFRPTYESKNCKSSNLKKAEKFIEKSIGRNAGTDLVLGLV